MSRRDELIPLYAADIRDKFQQEPDMDLLKAVTIGLGPSIYNHDSARVSGTDPRELETVRQNFLVGKLGLADSDSLMDAIREVLSIYGKSQRNKYRAVVYYMLVRHFGRESVYL
ncbi:DUF2853 family protein [Robiginitalea sp. SC105]|uniref:DUF2853 family protein n=1 Tax=Robiginitalea sp. SC105 TaxID=2762332 RepID=UPI00163B0817|nr:DUF2853 family protein [Robiginitalea sp. SC105]MBC2840710.1 DUF2853 family protein [Robiginitalea sp. SC105]